MDSTTPTRQCAPRARCRRWRICPACAAIRQAKIADAVERLHRLNNRATWTTLQPDHAGQAALIAARDLFLRSNAPSGAVWTVEAAPTSGRLHCNIITPDRPAETHPLASMFLAEIVGDPRNVGAYIAKQAQMPHPDAFTGRLYGTAGPLWQYLTSGQVPPPIQAAAIQYDIEPQPPTHPDDRQYPTSRERAREIAARHLPDLLPFRRAARPNQTTV